MNTKFILAGACCIALLTGCTSKSKTNSVQSVSATAEEELESTVQSSIQSRPQSTDTSQSTSSSTSESTVISSPKVPDYDIPHAIIDFKEVNPVNKTMTVSFTTDTAFRSDIKYYLEVYICDDNFDKLELLYDEPLDTSSEQLTIYLHESGNYYYIVRFRTDEKYGELSNAIYQESGEALANSANEGENDGENYNTPSNVKRHTLEFYTLEAGMFGVETMYGYPDYSEIEYYLSQGIQPEYINVDVYFICDFCETETYCETARYSYNEGELNLIHNVHCENRNCRMYKNSRIVKLFSRVN